MGKEHREAVRSESKEKKSGALKSWEKQGGVNGGQSASNRELQEGSKSDSYSSSLKLGVGSHGGRKRQNYNLPTFCVKEEKKVTLRTERLSKPAVCVRSKKQTIKKQRRSEGDSHSGLQRRGVQIQSVWGTTKGRKRQQ